MSYLARHQIHLTVTQGAASASNATAERAFQGNCRAALLASGLSSHVEKRDIRRGAFETYVREIENRLVTHRRHRYLIPYVDDCLFYVGIATVGLNPANRF